MQQAVALLAVPVKFIDLAGAAFSFRDQREGVGRKARRVGRARRRVNDRAFRNHRNFLKDVMDEIGQYYNSAELV